MKYCIMWEERKTRQNPYWSQANNSIEPRNITETHTIVRSFDSEDEWLQKISEMLKAGQENFEAYEMKKRTFDLKQEVYETTK